MRLKPIVLALAALTFVSSPRAASACSCGGVRPPCQNTFEVDAVFIGTVVNISPIHDATPLRPGEFRGPRAFRVEFSVNETFRGLLAATVAIETPADGPACGYAFRARERYLMYAKRTEGGVLTTTRCSRTRPMATAAEDLQFLRTLSATPTQARIYGTIHHRERYPAQDVQDYGPMSPVTITATGRDGTASAITDAQGRYELRVPPGTYDVEVSPPSGFSTRDLRRTVTLRDVRACHAADFGVRFDGRIAGHVRLPDGRPAVGAYVQIMPAEKVGQTGNIETLSAISTGDGSFELSEVPPGRYVVGVDLTRARMDPAVVFPTTFYPGTTDSTAATVVQMGGGARLELTPMTLPSPRRAYRLSGVVALENGQPAAGVTIFLQEGRERGGQVSNTTADAAGRFSFLVHDGLSYRATASYWHEVERKYSDGSAGPFTAGPNMTFIKLVLSMR